MLGAIEYLEWVGRTFGAAPGGKLSRKETLGAALEAIHAYEADLSRLMLEGLSSVKGLAIHGIVDPGSLDRRVATYSFTMDGLHPRAICERLDAGGINAWDGNYYAREVTTRLGLEGKGGMVRVGAVHYTTEDEVRKLVSCLESFASDGA